MKVLVITQFGMEIYFPSFLLRSDLHHKHHFLAHTSKLSLSEGMPRKPFTIVKGTCCESSDVCARKGILLQTLQLQDG